MRLHLGWSGDLDLPTEWIGEALGHLPHPLDAALLEAWNRRRLRVDGEGIARRPRTDPEFKTLRRGYVRSAGPRATIRRGAWRHVTATAHESRRALATRQQAGWALSEGYATAPLARLWEVTDGDRAELVEFFEEHQDRTETGGRLVAEWFGSSDPQDPPERRIRRVEGRLEALRDEVEGIAGALRDRPAAEKRVRTAVHRLEQARTSLRAAHAQVGVSGRERAASDAKAAPPPTTTRAGPWRGGVMVGLALLVVLASGCPVEPAPDTDPGDTGTPCEETAFHPDADGDGYGDPAVAVEACEAPEGHVAEGTDCDDADALTHPGAEESCAEAVDRNCDGTLPTDDLDADGSPACEDCDDEAVGVFPGAEERCDGVDEDCDGAVDEDAVDAPTWFADDDGDEHGDADATVTACEAPSGWVAVDGDCDDTDASVNPDAEDVCDDGIDQDCDGYRAYCVIEGEIDLGATPLLVAGEAEMDLFGAPTVVADIDGDGQDDLIVGATYNDRGGDRCGAVFLFHGPITGATFAEDADEVIVGDCSVAALFPRYVSTADLNGDGAEDLLVSRSTDLIVFHGPISGSTGPSDASMVLTGDSETGGIKAFRGGDLDGDGLSELVLSDAKATTNDGRVFVLPAPATSSVYTDEWTVRFAPDVPSSCDTGETVVADRDYDGDGYDDLVVGRQCTGTEGTVFVFRGPLSGDLEDAASNATIQDGTADLGEEMIGVDDMSGDGLPELLTGNRQPRSDIDGDGEVHVYFAPLEGALEPADAGWSIWGSEDYCAVGEHVATLDLDVDGQPDLVTAYEPGRCDGGHELGVVGVFYASDGLWNAYFDDASAGLLTPHGVSELAAGDLDGDGMSDLIVAAGAWSYRHAYDGVVFIISGRAR